MKIINEKYISELLEKHTNPDSNQINDVIIKAKEKVLV